MEAIQKESKQADGFGLSALEWKAGPKDTQHAGGDILMSSSSIIPVKKEAELKNVAIVCCLLLLQSGDLQNFEKCSS